MLPAGLRSLLGVLMVRLEPESLLVKLQGLLEVAKSIIGMGHHQQWEPAPIALVGGRVVLNGLFIFLAGVE